jgi:hypothetical protein
VEEARGLRGGELAPRSSPTPSPKVFSPKDASLPTETRRSCRVPERRTGDHRRTAIYRGHPGDGVQASMSGTGDASECHAAGGAPGQGIPATRRTESGAAPGQQRGWVDPRGNVPAGGTAIRQGLPGDNPRADCDGQRAAAAGATAALITAGGASGGGSARVERRSRERQQTPGRGPSPCSGRRRRSGRGGKA